MVHKKTVADKKVTYLVCVHQEEYSMIALQFVCKMAEQKNGRVIVLHVTESIGFQTLGSVANKMRAEREKEAKKLLKHATKDIIGLETVLMHREGLIEEEIIKVVEENYDIDMLIVGAAAETSSRSKTLQPLVSQLGNKIMIPMLIVPGNLTEQQMDLLT